MANGGTFPIDISLASPYWATKTTWKVLNKSLGSDHYIIKMTINDRVLYEDLRSPRVNLKTLKWNSFHVKCLASIAQELPSKDLEENARFITDSIAEAAKNSSTIYKGQQKRPLVPYWTNDCKEAVKVRNRKRAIYRRLRCESSFEEYKRAKGHAQWIIKSAKRAWLAETLCQFRRLHRPRHSLENHQRVEWQLLRSTNPPDRLRLWVSSRKHRKGRNASQILCISQQQRKSIPALCTHQDPASAETQNFSFQTTPIFVIP